MIGTWDSSSLKLYINGQLVASDNTAANGTMPNQSYLRINSEFNRTRGVGGFIYNVQMYNRALSAAEVSQNFNALRRRFGL
jgi:hypothetical protein